ncbi:hypothetical protein AZI87_15010 [Bdellovibrio bacteriovorus]|uniref:Lipoprotein n=1 Tax=Bdellovibrio bacteriovorus TaxID=959 RepID=A0A162FW78_BDEBC|nr:hypothetical protein [Bdellovibrio bacteriovorus]KYG62605.1 hypothetical protein AZI87_15010 [Bdellovibrio bacteriovorus]
MLKKLILATALLGVVGCAFNKDNPNNNATEVSDRQKQLNTYNRVTGFYTGKLTTTATQQDVELRLFTLEDESGTNANGEERYRIVLRGKFQFNSNKLQLVNMKARFIPETSELILRNEAASPGIDDVHTINAKVVGQKIVGEVKSVSGVIGVLDLTLASNQSSAPGNTEENEFYERLRRQYESFAGTYVGNNVKDGKAAFQFQIRLQVVKEGIVPKIIGELTRSDDPKNTATLTLTGLYRGETTPPSLVLTGIPRLFPSSPYKATIDGVLDGDTYKGTWVSNVNGFEGEFVLNKIK